MVLSVIYTGEEVTFLFFNIAPVNHDYEREIRHLPCTHEWSFFKERSSREMLEDRKEIYGDEEISEISEKCQKTCHMQSVSSWMVSA